MRKLNLLLLPCIFMLFVDSLFAQQKVLTGIVKSSTDQAPIGGVTVTLKELNRSVVTKEDGSFNISYSGDKAKSVEFTSVGFEYGQQSIGNGDHLTILMKPVAKSLGNW